MIIPLLVLLVHARRRHNISMNLIQLYAIKITCAYYTMCCVKNHVKSSLQLGKMNKTKRFDLITL